MQCADPRVNPDLEKKKKKARFLKVPIGPTVEMANE